VLILDANNLERNLYLATQVLETGIPAIFALNMWDMAKENGFVIDLDRLQTLFGTPCVTTVGNRQEGIEVLKRQIEQRFDASSGSIPYRAFETALPVNLRRQIAPVASNPQLSRQGFDTFYRTCATDDLQGPAAALFIAGELHAKRVFVLDDMTTYGRGLANELTKKLKGLKIEVVGHEGITQGDKDFTPLLTKIKSLAPDVVYFAGMFPEGALLMRQRAEVGLSARFMGGDGLFDAALITLATPQAAEGAYLTTIGSDIHQMSGAAEFVNAYEARFGPLGAYSAYAYEATNIAIWAIRQGGTN